MSKRFKLKKSPFSAVVAVLVTLGVVGLTAVTIQQVGKSQDIQRKAAAGDIIYQDTFDSDQGWEDLWIQCDKDQDCEITVGKLGLKTKTTSSDISLIAPIDDINIPYEVEASFEKVTGDKDYSYGLYFDNSYQTIEKQKKSKTKTLQKGENFRLIIYPEDKKWKIVKWKWPSETGDTIKNGFSNAIRKDQPNTLKVVTNGKLANFYINGTYLGSERHNHEDDIARVGVFARSQSIYTPPSPKPSPKPFIFEVRIDDFVVRSAEGIELIIPHPTQSPRPTPTARPRPSPTPKPTKSPR